MITLTPLIDVVFILLVFFMLASSFTDLRVIDIATAAPGGGASEKGALLIEVRDADVRLGGRPVQTEELLSELVHRLQSDPDQQVLIKLTAGADLQVTIDIVDLVANAGARDVSFLSPAGH